MAKGKWVDGSARQTTVLAVSIRAIFIRYGYIRRLESFVRAAETQLDPEADFDAVIAHEQAISPSLGGRSVFDDKPRQRSLF